MTRICQITKKMSLTGNRRSHAMNATKRKFFLNLHKHRLWDPQQKKFITLKISAKGLRIVNKYGISKVLKKYLQKK
ncbi:50S ribosomal protein L28 [Buchnera aphidicola]|uniref:Large ribosomal subunit protein bL28 n=1 Tax=Buchnera aphidicola subsp. Tuberolachnus salignus TaxID=98804 RepID=A0A170PBH8_BUCTT|nr:50S ribosomal protein L28 [Buchnera aphidicola]CUR53039.1 50S ribosomal protein L28 [Buchnera aphidicola (Tuberolachnus salignus)]